jgi:glycosyltransferase involved in cell wall biosynthesis
MKILFFCDVSGNFGNATRISKIYHYIKQLFEDVAFCNLHDFHGSWVKRLTNRALLVSACKNFSTLDLKYLKSEAFVSMGKEVLDGAVDMFQPDLIFAEETRTAYMALQNDANIPVIADLHGLLTSEYAESPDERFSDRHLTRLAEIESEVCNEAKDVITVSENMKEYIANEYGTPEEKITTVQNGADLHRASATYKSGMRFVFGGLFTHWEDIDTYLDMAREDSGGDYYLIGSGPLRHHILRRIKSEQIPMKFMGSLTKNRALDLFSNMTIGVAPSAQNVTRYVASPVKIYDYMACGLPVITADCGEWARHVEENGCGVVAQHSEAEAFLDCVAELQNRATWEEISVNCRKAIENKFNWNQVLKPIKTVIGKY